MGLDRSRNLWYKSGACLRNIPGVSILTIKEVNSVMQQCTLCNEHIEEFQMELGEAVEVDGEYWHADCFAEYFGEVLEDA